MPRETRSTKRPSARSLKAKVSDTPIREAKQPKPKTAGRPARAPRTKGDGSRNSPEETKPKLTKDQINAAQAAVFADGHNEPPPENTVCGARLSKKNPKTENNPEARCSKPAGFGTDHVGFGTCRYHGGTTKNHKMSAVKKEVDHRMRTFGMPVDISPKDALLAEVHRTAGHVQWLGDHIGQMERAALVGETVKGEQQMSAYVTMYQEERKMLVNVCRVAIATGVAERHVQVAEEQGRLIAMLLMKFMNDSELGLTPEQMMKAKPLAAQLLRTLPSLVTGGSTVVVPAQSRETAQVLDVSGEEV